jgi:hypothetical protein
VDLLEVGWPWRRSLELHADEDDGRYPSAGEARALLEGVTARRYGGVPPDVLGGWHYVEGLTQNDHRGVALHWTEENRGRRARARLVAFVGGDWGQVPDEDWPAFLKEQQRLLSKRDRLAREGGYVLTATILLPGGAMLDNYNASYDLDHEHRDRAGKERGKGRRSAGGPVQLKWRGNQLEPVGSGTMTLVLSLPKRRLRSRPVSYSFADGRADPASIVFVMEESR